MDFCIHGTTRFLAEHLWSENEEVKPPLGLNGRLWAKLIFDLAKLSTVWIFRYFFPFSATLDQESRSVTVRLNTRAPAAESTESTQK